MVDTVDCNKTSSNYKELFGLTRNRGAGSNKTRHGACRSPSLSLPLSSFNSGRSSVQQFRGLASIWLVEALSTSSRDGHEGLDNGNSKDGGLIISGTKNPDKSEWIHSNILAKTFPWIDGWGEKRPGGESSLNRNRFRNWFIENSQGNGLRMRRSWSKLVFTYKEGTWPIRYFLD